MFPGLVMVFVIDGLAMRIHRDSLRAKARANDHGKRAIVPVPGHIPDRDHRTRKNRQNHKGYGQYFDPVFCRGRKRHGAQDIGSGDGMQKKKNHYDSIC